MLPGLEAGADAVGAHVEDPRLRVRGVGHDAGLRARQRDRLAAEVVERHRAQRARDPLAGREQHVHLARVRLGRDLLRHLDQLVGRRAARRQHRDDASALVARAHHPLRRADQALRRRRPTCRRTSSRRCRSSETVMGDSG